MSIFEIAMLVCFGAAWPMSIVKSYRSRTTAGKSLLFMVIIGGGYVAGIFHKILFSFDGVIFLYGLNAAMVLTDIVLYFRNRNIEARALGVAPGSASRK